jgi:hypothetical protein
MRPSRAVRDAIDTASSKKVADMLSKMTHYFFSMVDPRTHRFYYRCLPASNKRIHDDCPIRDMGSAWDTATLLRYWQKPLDSDELDQETRQRLSRAVEATIQAYGNGPWETYQDQQNRSCIYIPSAVLHESSNIAHSAFLILATTGALRLNHASMQVTPLDDLVRGILSMQQQPSGAFAIHFGDPGDVFRGIEFYPGEAMLALLDAYELEGVLSPSTSQAILPAVQQAFLFYSGFYRGGQVSERYTSFFGNWQVQCFAKLYKVLKEKGKPATLKSDESSHPAWLPDAPSVTASLVSMYIFELCDAIVDSTSWKILNRGRYELLSTVEIACGLEALAEGTEIAIQSNDMKRSSRYWQSIEKATRLLRAVQDQVSTESVGYGGLGYGLSMSEQRLDVTGHAVNALIKVSHLIEMRDSSTIQDM